MLFGYTPLELLVLLVSILVSMSVHEAMHAYVGFRLGDTTAAEAGRISLNPLSHIDPFMTLLLPIVSLVLFGAPIMAAKPVPFNAERVRYGEFGAALIALAGPASNLVLAILAAVILRNVQLGHFISSALATFMTLNIALLVFNLVPIPPLDGSRILYAFAPEAVQRIMRSVEPYGLALVFILVFASGFGSALVRINGYLLHLLAGA
jgi:Zn-dependent protease